MTFFCSSPDPFSHAAPGLGRLSTALIMRIHYVANIMIVILKKKSTQYSNLFELYVRVLVIYRADVFVFKDKIYGCSITDNKTVSDDFPIN